jgi:hypothetical protein
MVMLELETSWLSIGSRQVQSRLDGKDDLVDRLPAVMSHTTPLGRPGPKVTDPLSDTGLPGSELSIT